MKKVKFIFIGVFVALFSLASCVSEEKVSQAPDQSTAAAVRKSETIEMKNFKEALVSMTKQKAEAQKRGETTSLFKEDKQKDIIDQAKALLFSEGYQETDLASTDRAVIMQAMKVYAERTQIITNSKQ